MSPFRFHTPCACWLLLLCLVLSGVIVAPAWAKETVTITVVEGDYDNYRAFLTEFGGGLHSVESIPHGYFDRATMDIFLLVNALRAGGLEGDLDFRLVGNVKRLTEDLYTGAAVVGGHQLGRGNNEVYKNDLYMSSAVIRPGDFQKGIYCLPSNSRALRIRDRRDLRLAGPAIIGIHWKADFKALKEMGVEDIVQSPTFPLMIRMLDAGRASWIPLEFSGKEDLSKVIYGVRLVPVPGVKFVLDESRHFFVSRAHPDGERVFAALQKGLALLRENGTIRRALTAAGFFNSGTASWTSLNEGLVRTD